MARGAGLLPYIVIFPFSIGLSGSGREASTLMLRVTPVVGSKPLGESVLVRRLMNEVTLWGDTHK